jgi:hypothetical protein
VLLTTIGPYLESHDAAKILEVTAETVRAAVRCGRLIPDAKTSRGLSLFSLSTVEAFRLSRETRNRGRK